MNIENAWHWFSFKQKVAYDRLYICRCQSISIFTVFFKVRVVFIRACIHFEWSGTDHSPYSGISYHTRGIYKKKDNSDYNVLVCKYINLPGFNNYYNVILFKGTTASWGNMFMSLSAVYICGGVVYVILGSSDELPWYSQAKQSEKVPEISNISQIVIRMSEKSEYGHWNGRR